MKREGIHLIASKCGRIPIYCVSTATINTDGSHSLSRIGSGFSKPTLNASGKSRFNWEAGAGYCIPPTPTMSSLNPLTFYLVLVTSTLFVWNRYKKRNHRPSLPPGPPADPLIGHLRVIPTKDHAKIYHDWSMVYGTSLA